MSLLLLWILRWLLTSRQSIFFFSPSRLTNRRKNGLNHVLQYTSSAPSLREGRDQAQAFFSQSD
jgi:hypothetical protein